MERIKQRPYTSKRALELFRVADDAEIDRAHLVSSFIGIINQFKTHDALNISALAGAPSRLIRPGGFPIVSCTKPPRHFYQVQSCWGKVRTYGGLQLAGRGLCPPAIARPKMVSGKATYQDKSRAGLVSVPPAATCSESSGERASARIRTTLRQMLSELMRLVRLAGNKNPVSLLG